METMDAATLLLRLDDATPMPLHRQILEGLQQRVVSGAVRPGERLPSTRRLADNLGVHRSTVALAYQELWSRGFVDLRPGARPRVRERTRLVTPSSPVEEGLIDWQGLASDAANDVLMTYRELHACHGASAGTPVISFKSLDLDRRLLPVEPFRACLKRVMAAQGEALLGYGDPAGHRPLREYLAERLQRHGISVAADEILLTHGAQQGIDLVLRMIASPGKSVAIESPTYGFMLPLLRLSGLKPVAVPLGPDGMDLAGLDQTLRRQRPVLVYTMPSFQNPTGVCTSQTHREKLLALCETHRVPILEDGFEEEMKYTGRVVLPLKSMDRHRIVIYCGTFSKVLFPGARIGWVAADRSLIERLTAIRRFGELSPSAVLPAAMNEFCRNGSYDRHVSRMHRIFRRRMQVATGALREHIRPGWAEWAEPRGGYLIWLRLKPLAARAGDLEALLAEHRVQVEPGRFSFCSERPEHYVRLSISTLAEDEIREGVLRLSRALREAYGTSRRARRGVAGRP